MMEKTSLKIKLQEILITKVEEYEIHFYPFNQKHLQFQISDGHATLDFSDNLEDSISKMYDRILTDTTLSLKKVS